jgi:hypothetical protein
MLPTGFKVKAKTHIKKPVTEIDNMIASYLLVSETEPFLIPVTEAIKLIEKIADTFEEANGWDVHAYTASLDYLCQQPSNEEWKGKVWVIVRKGREAQRTKQDGRYENSPDSYQEKGKAREIAQEIPALILLRQNGDEQNGWTGHPFWWPVLVTPKNTKTVVFTSEQVGVEE